MSEAVGEVLAFGIGVALSPAAVIAAVLLVIGPNGRASAGLFVVTWALSLAVVGATALLLADGAGASDAGGPADWVVVVQIALALLLVVLAVSEWRGRLRDGVASEMPLWMRKVDGLTARQAVGMAIFLASGKPKNLLLTVGAAVAIARARRLGGRPGGRTGRLRPARHARTRRPTCDVAVVGRALGRRPGGDCGSGWCARTPRSSRSYVWFSPPNSSVTPSAPDRRSGGFALDE